MRGTVIRSGRGGGRLSKRLGDLLVDARNGRTRRELAGDLGVSPNTLREVEHGLRNVTLGYIEGLEDAYGLELDLVARPRAKADMPTA